MKKLFIGIPKQMDGYDPCTTDYAEVTFDLEDFGQPVNTTTVLNRDEDGKLTLTTSLA